MTTQDVILATDPVSYTHLDVYKRQTYVGKENYKHSDITLLMRKALYLSIPVVIVYILCKNGVQINCFTLSYTTVQ